jgi:hypothetical protein
VREGDEDFVSDLGQHHRAAVPTGPRLHHPGPERHVSFVHRGESDTHAPEALRVAHVGDDADVHTRDRTTERSDTAGDEAQHRPVVPPAHDEMRLVAARVVHVPRRRQGVLAVERLTDERDAHRRSGLQLRVAGGDPFRLGERAGELLRERARRDIDLQLRG